MATLVQAYRPTRFDGLLILKGFLCSLLVAVVRYADSVLWHCCHSLNGEPFCCSTVTKHCRQPSSMNLLLPESVHTFFGLDGPCHISSWYVQSIVLGYFAVDIRGHFHRGLPHIVASTRLDCASSGYGMQDVRIGLNQYLGVQARLSPGKKDTRSDTLKNSSTKQLSTTLQPCESSVTMCQLRERLACGWFRCTPTHQ